MVYKKPSDIERRRLLLAILIPFLFIVMFWAIKLIELGLNISLASYGMRPRDLSQWFGVITMPFLHSGFSHLMANSSGFLVLGTIIFYFYSRNAFTVFGLAWLLTGIFTWIIGRENTIHIGASGLVYAFAGFIFFSGLLSKNVRLMAVSLFVVFMYGSMIWGIFPGYPNISWEGHLAGFITGVGLAILYHPGRELDEEPDDCTDCTVDEDIEITYTYKE